MSSESDSEDQSEDYEIINLHTENFVLFVNDRGDVMHFLLQLRNKEDERRIHTLIQKHFGSVAEGRHEFGPHTIVLVDDKVLSWCHDRDVFKVSYIEECIAKGVVLDISQFLLKKENSDSDSSTHSAGSSKCTFRGLPYSRSEKEAILKYVVKHHSSYGTNKLKGVSLWQTMEREKICNRTWQSMKEHFLKILVRDMSSFKYISQEEKEIIKNALK